MEFTTGFKRFLTLLILAIVIFGGGYVAQKKNYWGLLDEAPKAEVPTEQAVAPIQPAQAGIPVRQEEPVYPPASQPEPQHQPEPEPVQEAPKASSNKLKNLKF